MIMLAGIYYGAQYGGSTTAILVNLPGETSAVVACIDGYQMTLKGRAGLALVTAGDRVVLRRHGRHRRPGVPPPLPAWSPSCSARPTTSRSCCSGFVASAS